MFALSLRRILSFYRRIIAETVEAFIFASPDDKTSKTSKMEGVNSLLYHSLLHMYVFKAVSKCALGMDLRYLQISS